MKKITRLTAATAAAVLLAGILAAPAFAVGDERNISQSSYTTPMPTDRTSSKYKKFTASKPTGLKESGGYYSYYSGLEWNKTENAMLYYVYKKVSGKFALVGKTADTFMYFEDMTVDSHEGTYYIKAVSYDYSDKRILSKASDTVNITNKYVYDDDLYGVPETTTAAYGGLAYNSVSYDSNVEYEMDDGYYEEEAYYEDDGWFEEEEDTYSNEEYSHYDPNGFKNASDTPLSTFSADVDTASYTNVRRLANSGASIDADSVRTEEFLNYFDYKFTQPKKGYFSYTYEYSSCPWNKDAKLLMLGIQAKDVAKEPASNLVFLIDVSGSMYSQDKLPLVGESLKKLSSTLTKNDRLSIVTYSGNEKVIVSGAYGNMKNCISDIADALIADGSTNGEAGLNMAYDIAKQNYIKDGSNRVIMATDGDLNVGISDKDDLSEFIADKRDSGVYLTMLGFGTGNVKDDNMEALAKDGNGNYYYIDCAAEASKVLIDERKSTLFTVADDVKLQVEFNPNVVKSYRLVGYEGRRLNNEDFADDKKDAADMGAGQSITVMYEIIPADSAQNNLKYQSSTGNKTDVCTVSIRYKEPGKTKSKLSKITVKKSSYLKYSDTGIRFRFATCVAETAMYLRNDTQYGEVSLKNAYSRFKKLKKSELSQIGYSDDFADLIEKLMENER